MKKELTAKQLKIYAKKRRISVEAAKRQQGVGAVGVSRDILDRFRTYCDVNGYTLKKKLDIILGEFLDREES